jgi:3-phenylpropionate/trans-cinnamate dioxygenase ferredoxin subunit
LGFVKVASAKGLGAGKMVGAEAGGKPILVANVDGKYYAIGDKCTHRGCKLSGGTLKEDGVVECPCHGSNFDVKTGNVVKGPAKTPEPAFKVKVEKDDVLVDI